MSTKKISVVTLMAFIVSALHGMPLHAKKPTANTQDATVCTSSPFELFEFDSMCATATLTENRDKPWNVTGKLPGSMPRPSVAEFADTWDAVFDACPLRFTQKPVQALYFERWSVWPTPEHDTITLTLRDITYLAGDGQVYSEDRVSIKFRGRVDFATDPLPPRPGEVSTYILDGFAVVVNQPKGKLKITKCEDGVGGGWITGFLTSSILLEITSP